MGMGMGRSPRLATAKLGPCVCDFELTCVTSNSAPIRKNRTISAKNQIWFRLSLSALARACVCVRACVGAYVCVCDLRAGACLGEYVFDLVLITDGEDEYNGQNSQLGGQVSSLADLEVGLGLQLGLRSGLQLR